MKAALEAIRQKIVVELQEAHDMQTLENIRVKFLGKKGELTAILKQMGKLSAEERPVIGQLANEIRAFMEDHIATRTAQLKNELTQQKLKAEKLDVTLPGKKNPLGKKHPLNIVLDEIKEIFLGMGFDVLPLGPEVESDYYNFEALNMPKDHPARDTQDTFYVSDNVRYFSTQTSPMQVRVMEKRKAPHPHYCTWPCLPF